MTKTLKELQRENDAMVYPNDALPKGMTKTLKEFRQWLDSLPPDKPTEKSVIYYHTYSDGKIAFGVAKANERWQYHDIQKDASYNELRGLL